jgi:broad specificity phosphatase PhoE
MPQILLVRHGQASWGAEDYDVLSDVGEEQAALVGKALTSRRAVPDVVLHGAMVRQRRTAELAAEAAGWSAVPELDVDWDEMDHVEILSVHPAPFAGREPTREEFQSWFEDATDRWVCGEHDADYQEPFQAFTDRVVRALHRAAERVGEGGTVVVFTSGGPISWVTAALVGGDRPTHRRLAPVVVNASITKVVTGRRGPTLVTFNDHAHLEEAGRRLLTYR